MPLSVEFFMRTNATFDKQTTRSSLKYLLQCIADNDVSKREEGDGRRVQEGAETVGEALPEGEHSFLVFVD